MGKHSLIILRRLKDPGLTLKLKNEQKGLVRDAYCVRRKSCPDPSYVSLGGREFSDTN